MRIDAGTIEILIQLGEQFGIEEVFDLLGTFVEARFTQHKMLREERFPQAVRPHELSRGVAPDFAEPQFRTGPNEPTTTKQRPRRQPCEQSR